MVIRTVYVDEIFFVNILADYILLYLTFSFLRINVTFKKIFISSCVGGMFSVLYSVLFENTFCKIILSAVMLLVMLYLCLGHCNVNTYKKSFVMMYMFSAILGGITIFVADYVKKDFIILAIVFSIILLFLFYKKIGVFFANSFSSDYVNVRIWFSDYSCDVKLLCDSGNLLIDPYTSLPIIIVNSELFLSDMIYALMVRFVPAETVIGKGFIRVVTPDKIELLIDDKNREVKAAVGFADNFKSHECKYDGIMPSSLLNNA